MFLKMSFILRCLFGCLFLFYLLGLSVHIINKKPKTIIFPFEAILTALNPNISLNPNINPNISQSTLTPKPNISLRPPIGWQSNIDIAILWSGPPKPHRNGTDVVRERYNSELPYSLRSIALHAPWVRKIWILVNTDSLPKDTEFVPSSLRNRTMFVDRCSYMPKGTCPTRNSHAVKSFSHRIPGLAEHFILIDDDIFLGRPVKPSHFYDNGKPFVWRHTPTWGFFAGKKFHRLYKDPSVVSFPTPNSAAPCPHFWNPQLKSVCAWMEQQYPEFYAFVGQHTVGRYSSLAKGPSDTDNSQEEDMIGFMNWAYLREGKGVFKNINNKQNEWWAEAEISEAGFKRFVKNHPIFMNVNDRFSKDAKMYERQMGWYHTAMESMFPISNKS